MEFQSDKPKSPAYAVSVRSRRKGIGVGFVHLPDLPIDAIVFLNGDAAIFKLIRNVVAQSQVKILLRLLKYLSLRPPSV
jgi:hypothetical protein